MGTFKIIIVTSKVYNLNIFRNYLEKYVNTQGSYINNESMRQLFQMKLKSVECYVSYSLKLHPAVEEENNLSFGELFGCQQFEKTGEESLLIHGLKSDL
jgi:hypothetical protein